MCSHSPNLKSKDFLLYYIEGIIHLIKMFIHHKFKKQSFRFIPHICSTDLNVM